VTLGNIDSLLRRIIRRKNSQASGKSNSSSSSTLNFKGKSIVILGIAVAVIGFAGTIYFGSLFVKEEVNTGATLPYTNLSHIKSALPMDLEIVFVIIAVIGFGILTYGLVSRVDKPLDFYPT
jgi:hypothetical protein